MICCVESKYSNEGDVVHNYGEKALVDLRFDDFQLHRLCLAEIKSHTHTQTLPFYALITLNLFESIF